MTLFRFILLLGLLAASLTACAVVPQPPPSPAPTENPAPSLTVTVTAPTATTAAIHTPTAVSAEPSATPVAATATPSAPVTATVAPPTPSPTAVRPVAITRQQGNLRAGPGTDYDLVGEVGAGQEVIPIARSADGEWFRLDMEGLDETWIAAFLLRLPFGLDVPVASVSPTAVPASGDAVAIGETSISLPTYPWRQFTRPIRDETTQWDVTFFDRAAYEASNPLPSPKTYRLLTLENRWLRLTVMPELGGRLYQLFFKPTGHNELYQNPVVKPSPWGPDNAGNGWLAAGGIEWGFPVAEHGYTWAEPWGYITELRPPAAAITVFTQDLGRPQLNVHIGLEPDLAAVLLDFDIGNLGEVPVEVAYWTNAMLAPGAANKVGHDLHFLYPGRQMAVHSTGESDLPGAAGLFGWPIHNGRDISRLGTWNQWLGFFAYPQAQAGWSAVYDVAADEGVVRTFEPDKTPGLKGFGLGWSQPIAAGNYTDDDSSYVEMQGGLRSTFADTVTLQPGDGPGWREVWYPVAGIGGITLADANGAAHVTSEDGGLRLRLFSVRSRTGTLVVSGAQSELLRLPLTIDPAHPADIQLPAAVEGPIGFRLETSGGPGWSMSGLEAARQ